MTSKKSSEKLVRDIKRITRRKYSSEEKIRIVIEGMRGEYNTNPLGVETSEPCLSWILESDERGEKQTAYRVLVASSLQKLQANNGDFWYIGKIEAFIDSNNKIAYESKSNDFIVFEFQSGSYEINAVGDFKL